MLLRNTCNKALPLRIDYHSPYCFINRKRLSFRSPIVAEVTVSHGPHLFILYSNNEAVLGPFLLYSGYDIANPLLVSKARSHPTTNFVQHPLRNMIAIVLLPGSKQHDDALGDLRWDPPMPHRVCFSAVALVSAPMNLLRVASLCVWFIICTLYNDCVVANLHPLHFSHCLHDPLF